MKKWMVLILCLAGCSGLQAAGWQEMADRFEQMYQTEVQAPCRDMDCYNKAVKNKNIRKIKKTLFHTSVLRLKKYLRQGVKVQGRAITVPEYFIAEGAIGPDFMELFPFWVVEYKGDKVLWGDTLLEKLSLNPTNPYQMQMAEAIIKELGLKSVSARTLAYAAAQAVNQEGLDYLQRLAKMKRNPQDMSWREQTSYPMPYALPEGNVCQVVSQRMQNAPEGDAWDYLREAKKVLGCQVTPPGPAY